MKSARAVLRCARASQFAGLRPAARRPTARRPLVPVRQMRCCAAAAAPKKEQTIVRRCDYVPPPFAIGDVSLDISIDNGDGSPTVVRCTQNLRRSNESCGDLVLNAVYMDVVSVTINGVALSTDQYTAEAEHLRIHSAHVPDGDFVLATEVHIHPRKNSQLSGLYLSGTVFTTQCEAEGFRHITPSFDRPDALAQKYTCRLEADKSIPVLLSNGNLVDSGECGADRHFAVWEDPFPKPSYLFAVVAGKLARVADTFVTMSGKKVDLALYTEEHNKTKLGFALECLKKAMKWDEEKYGREYDLNLFNIVAVDHFNMAAMENKSLNVFATAYILADPKISTDDDYEKVLSVIAHEYFHNWTGNRVTCRDWFQITLKEGLTVFRDQQFSADVTSPAVQRIEQAALMQTAQFAEDRTPMSHSVRPEQYEAIDNFYTATVYYKGAEVIRMYHTLLGDSGFRKGMDLYFDRHDGQAVTCDDFRAAMADANGKDLTQFEEWYKQKGTPVVTVKTAHDEETGVFKVEMEQTNGEYTQPLQIPVSCALISRASGEVVAERVLDLSEKRQVFEFSGVESGAVLSALRGFSAPVKLDMAATDADKALIAAHDPDPVAAWRAGRELSIEKLQALSNASLAGEELVLPDAMRAGFRSLLLDRSREPSLRAYSMQLPDGFATEPNPGQPDGCHPDHLHNAMKFVRRSLAAEFRSELLAAYEELTPAKGGETDMSAEAIGRRRLRNVCLRFLASLGDEEVAELCWRQLSGAQIMTDAYGALLPLCSLSSPKRDEGLAHFWSFCGGDRLGINKWFAAQARADLPDQVERTSALLQHKDFDWNDPGRMYAVLGGFAANLPHFHNSTGSGYTLIADAIGKIDEYNSQVAARLMRAFLSCKYFEAGRRELMLREVDRLSTTKLSKNSAEVARNILSTRA
eukprot:TRINITY_DN9898_c0_g1_i1.p1 TRINITY_DN9898_c0_g1~~TRINITY_DN9898_c0_g1_i1.p1  ORF type:complete len:937 (+),score=296.01 TRINITY_DN9898_c0_g1_i1:54-2813(+)